MRSRKAEGDAVPGTACLFLTRLMWALRWCENQHLEGLHPDRRTNVFTCLDRRHFLLAQFRPAVVAPKGTRSPDDPPKAREGGHHRWLVLFGRSGRPPKPWRPG